MTGNDNRPNTIGEVLKDLERAFDFSHRATREFYRGDRVTSHSYGKQAAALRVRCSEALEQIGVKLVGTKCQLEQI